MPQPVAPPAPLRHVFVYGTLRRGGTNDINRLSPAPRYLGAARVAGALYHLGAYPGLVLGGSQWVWGEVYAIDPSLEAMLDVIEDLGPEPTDEYTKRDVVIDLGGDPVVCLLYEINPHYITGAPHIAHGDWMQCVDEECRSRDVES